GQHVTAMLEDHSGAVWLGADHRLLVFKNDRFREIKGLRGNPFAGDDEVSAIAEDASHTVWVLTLDGRLFSVAADGIREHAKPDAALASLEYLAADQKGGVWIGSKRGTVFYYREGRYQTIPLTDSQGPVHIYGLFVAADDSVLISTPRGLYRWKDGQLSALTSEHGLPCDQVYTVITDNRRALWISTQCGVLKVDAAECATS